jgi:hypothetical protein
MDHRPPPLHHAGLPSHRLGVFVSDIVPTPVGMSTIYPQADFMPIHLAVPLLQDRREGGEVAVNRLQIIVGNFIRWPSVDP